MNRINKLFQVKKDHILSMYFTAGFPAADSTIGIIKALQNSGVDMVEIGIPFSDPMADGPVIQQSSSTALKNGMNLRKLFGQLKNIRHHVEIPIILMGYLNPVLQFGMEQFCRECAEVGIDGLILPDLPADIFESEYSEMFSRNGLANIFLITPQTSEERIRVIDQRSKGFIYMVSSSSTTGVKGKFSNEQVEYFRRIQLMNLKNPVMAGFGISDHETFETVCQHARGAIIGSAFVKMVGEASDLNVEINQFVSKIKKPA